MSSQLGNKRSVQVLQVHVTDPATSEQHIASLQWYHPGTGQIAVSTTFLMVKFLKEGGGAYTCDGTRISVTEVIEADPPYLRTRPDATTTNNLLTLPRF
jgi:hypothetical protein